MRSKLIKFLKVIIPALILGVGFSYLITFASTSSPPNPPAGNPFPPINTAAFDQIKQFVNGVGFLGLDYLKAPPTIPSDWAKKAGSSTLCADAAGKIIICRVYVAPTATLTIDPLTTTIEPDLAGVDEENHSTYTYREFGLSNIARFHWSVTKNTNLIDTLASKSINFSTPTTGASINVSDTDSIKDTNNTSTSSTNILATGQTQSGTIVDDTNNYSAQDVNSSFKIEAYDVTDLGSGQSLATATANVYWRNKIYCGTSGINYIIDNISSYDYVGLPGNLTNWHSPYQILTDNASSVVCPFPQVNEYGYVLVPVNLGPILCFKNTATGNKILVNNSSSSAYNSETIYFKNKWGYPATSSSNYRLYKSPNVFNASGENIQPLTSGC